VVPTGKIDSVGWVDTIVTDGEQASDAVVAMETGALHAPGGADTVIGPAQLIAGAVESTTVTLPSAWLVAPLGSITVSRTGVVPTGYGPAGDCVIVSASPSASSEPSSTDAEAPQV
jgi:hypothetical protein